jgi:hypothetical protein
VPATGGWQNWTTLSCNLALGVTGYHNVYLVYTSGMNIKSFAFEGALNGTEASSYNSVSAGEQLESCSEGGEDLCYIDNGTYAAYNNINLNGATTFTARVAGNNAGGNIEVCLDSPTGTVIGTATVPVTGSWQTWTTVSCNLSGASGWHNVYLVFTGAGTTGLFNVEWFAFQGSNNYTAAASYNSLSGALYLQGDTEGGQNLAGITNGNYAVYNGVNLNGATGFQARVASAGAGGNIAIHVGSATGTLIGTCAVPVTGGWQNWTNVSCALNSSATGIQNVYLVFTGGSGYLLNMEGFEFQSVFAPIAAASYNVSLSTSSLSLQGCSEGGENLQNINSGNYAVYNNINLTGATTFTARVASPNNGGTIVLHLDSPTGTVIGTCTVPDTGGWQTWTTVSCPVSGASGTHNIYMVFTTGGLNLEWFEF